MAVALHAVLLSQELQRSRERLVAAREEERRRLRRDLHDGLGPILTAVTLKADAARSALDTAPTQADGLLAELRGDAKQAIGDLRRVVEDLRPAALDELGLLGALSQQMDRFARQGVSITLDQGRARAAEIRIVHRSYRLGRQRRDVAGVGGKNGPCRLPGQDQPSQTI